MNPNHVNRVNSKQELELYWLWQDLLREIAEHDLLEEARAGKVQDYFNKIGITNYKEPKAKFAQDYLNQQQATGSTRRKPRATDLGLKRMIWTAQTATQKTKFLL